MDRRTILEIAETEVPAAALTFADALFEPLARQIAEQIEERVNHWLDEALPSDGLLDQLDQVEKLARDLVQPSFSMHVMDRLAYQIGLARDGHRQIFWNNIAERYAATGEV